VERDLSGDRCIDVSVKLWRTELGLDPDLRQLVAQLHVVAQLAARADVDVQIAALGLVRLHRGFDATHSQHPSERCNGGLIGGVERWRSVFLTDPDPATLAAHLVPAQ
jgi:hypothetical protein